MILMEKNIIMGLILPELRNAVEQAKIKEKGHSQIIQELKERFDEIWMKSEDYDEESQKQIKFLRYLYNMEGNL